MVAASGKPNRTKMVRIPNTREKQKAKPLSAANFPTAYDLDPDFVFTTLAGTNITTVQDNNGNILYTNVTATATTDGILLGGQVVEY